MKIPPKADPPPAENTKTKKNMQYHTPIPRSIKNLGFLLTVLLFSGLIITIVNAALTFTGTTIESDGPLSVVFEGATADDFELTLAATDPTADRTATIPNLSANDTFALLTQTQTLASKTLTAPKFADLDYLADTNGNKLIVLDSVTNAVNEITVANASTNTNPTITASGGDTNIGITVTTKGTGNLQLTTGSFKVGDGTPGVSLDGEDAYIEGTLEVDGNVQLDGDVNVASAKFIGFNNSDVRFRNNAANTLLFEGGNLTLSAGTKIAHESVTSGAHGVNFSMIGTLNWNDANIATGQTVGVIPANADITGVRALILTAFAGTGLSDGNNYIDCGPSGNLTAYVATLGVASNNITTNRLTYITASGPAANFTDVGASNITVQCRHQGANLTAGQVKLIIDYVID